MHCVVVRYSGFVSLSSVAVKEGLALVQRHAKRQVLPGSSVMTAGGGIVVRGSVAREGAWRSVSASAEMRVFA